MSIAGRLLPGQCPEFAAFGRCDAGGTASGPFRSVLPLATGGGAPAKRAPDASSILAIGNDRLFLIYLDDDPMTAEMIAVFDARAELVTFQNAPLLRLTESDILGSCLDAAFEIGFTVAANPPWSPEVLAAHLAEGANQPGDPAKSGYPVIRFLARSIHAHQTDEPQYLSELLPPGYREFVRRTSVGGAIRKLTGEDEWFASFLTASEAAAPDEDEIFLLFEAGWWIVTNRRLYLTDARHAPEAVRLEEIRAYGYHGLFRKTLEIRLASGRVIRRPGTDMEYLSEHDFDRLMAILSEAGEVGERVRGQTG